MTRDLEGWELSENEARMLNHRERQEFQRHLRHKMTRQGQFEKMFLHFDHPLPGVDRLLESSDNGKAAADIRAACEVTPLWRKIWIRERSRLTQKQRRILDALLVDWRTTQAARMAGVSTASVKLFKKTFFKKHFAQCFKAWEHDFGH